MSGYQIGIGLAFAAAGCIALLSIRFSLRHVQKTKELRRQEEEHRTRRAQNREIFRGFFLKMERHFDRFGIPVSLNFPNDTIYQPLDMSAVSAALTHSRFQIIVNAVEDELIVDFGQQQLADYKEVETSVATHILLSLFGDVGFCVRHAACSLRSYRVEEIADGDAAALLIRKLYVQLMFVDQLWKDFELKRRYIANLQQEIRSTEQKLYESIRDQCESHLKAPVADRLVQPQP
ncbi:MAG TPA: hypothetical protein VG866_02460 [Candidatus Paceibacterota bacterium]|nr:hypothetical protein [Candidatus Paceibacterota bacterium]